MYGVQWDGHLKAWDSTGTAANRAPVWSVQPDDANFSGGATIAGNRILVRDESGHIYARDLATGAPVWRTTEPGDCGLPGNYQGPPVVVDGMVL